MKKKALLVAELLILFLAIFSAMMMYYHNVEGQYYIAPVVAGLGALLGLFQDRKG